MRILISGAGIAGLTLAYSLQRSGVHEVTIVEKSGALRDEGYMIDFFGSGYDAAERLGLLADLERIHFPVDRLEFSEPGGRRKFAIRYARIRRLFDGRHFNFLRGDLERLLYTRVAGSVNIRFGVSVESLLECGAMTGARFSDGSEGLFDVVVGADGIHSRVRGLVFGEEREFARFLGYRAATFILPAEAPRLADPDVFTTITAPGKQVGLYPVRGGRSAALFVYRSPEPLGDFSFESAAAELRRVYGGMPGKVAEALARVDRSTFYFDDVTQIEMAGWCRGQLTLVGDACQCVSLVAGQGASLAMAGAFVLAEELADGSGDVAPALGRYESRVRPAVARVQEAGRRIARWFVPESRFGLTVRDGMTRAVNWPLAGSLFRRSLASRSIL